MTKEEEKLKQENAVNMKIASKSLLEMKNERDQSLQENQHLTDYIIKANAQIEELMRENTELRRRLDSSLPEDCIKGYYKVKFCSIRNGDGGGCQHCR